MRQSHQHDPLHCIECWTGTHFRAAALWEVGVYILIKHHGVQKLCDALDFQKTFLDDIQAQKDELDEDLCWDKLTAENDLKKTMMNGKCYHQLGNMMLREIPKS